MAELPHKARRRAAHLAARAARRLEAAAALPGTPAPAPAPAAPPPPSPQPPADPHEAEALRREEADNLHLELLLGFLLREDDDCIDVGANQGRFLTTMVQRAPRGRHVAFEPLPELAAGLRAAFPQVEVHEAALSDTAGQATFLHVLEDPAYSGFRERSYPGAYTPQEITVAVEVLDEVLPDGLAPRVIKVDVEGNELAVFRGARETLSRHRPHIVFEHGMGAADRYGTTAEDVHDLLVGDCGLRLFDLSAHGPLGRDEFAELMVSGKRWNWLARA